MPTAPRPDRRRPGALAAQALALALAVVLAALLVAGLVATSSALAAGGWAWPVEGQVVTGYRNGEDPYAAGQHRGIDVAAAEGTAVRAATDGTVRFAGAVGSAGTTISIRTADGRHDTSYLHLGSLAVEAGESVSRGDLLGSVGTSGRRSTRAPHLHFGVRDAGERHAYRDPLRFLEAPAPAPGPPPASPAVPPRPRPAPAPRPRAAPVGPRARAPVWRPRTVGGRSGAAVPRGALAAPALEAPERAPSPSSGPLPWPVLAALGAATALALLARTRHGRAGSGLRGTRRGRERASRAPAGNAEAAARAPAAIRP